MQAQRNDGIKEEKILNVSTNSASRWNGVHTTTARNNVLMDAIDSALRKAPTPSAANVDDNEYARDEEIDNALTEAFGELHFESAPFIFGVPKQHAGD